MRRLRLGKLRWLWWLLEEDRRLRSGQLGWRQRLRLERVRMWL